VYQVLSELAKVVRRFDKNILAYFSLGHGVYFCVVVRLAPEDQHYSVCWNRFF